MGADDQGFNGGDRQLLRRLEEQVMNLRLDVAERLSALETHVNNMEKTLASKVGKESFQPVKWLIYTVVAAAIAVSVTALFNGAGGPVVPGKG